MALDRLDRRILSVLQRDGRITNQRLADVVGLSPSACLRRVQNLERAGVIVRYGAVVEPARLGLETTVIVQITLERQTEEALGRFEEAIKREPSVQEAYLMSGSSDYMLRVLVRSPGEYERLHKEVLSRLPGVLHIQSSLAMRTVIRRSELDVDAP